MSVSKNLPEKFFIFEPRGLIRDTLSVTRCAEASDRSVHVSSDAALLPWMVGMQKGCLEQPLPLLHTVTEVTSQISTTPIPVNLPDII